MRLTFYLLILSLNVISYAQQSSRNSDHQLMPDDDMDQLKSELNLSDEQVSKWEAVNLKYKPEFDSLAAVDSLEQRQKIRYSREIRRRRDAELKEFIFAAQWEKYPGSSRLIRRSRDIQRRPFDRHRQTKDNDDDGN